MKVEKKAVIADDLKNMLQHTEETLAAHFEKQMSEGKLKRFSVADLWKLEKRQRFTQTMRRWN